MRCGKKHVSVLAHIAFYDIKTSSASSFLFTRSKTNAWLIRQALNSNKLTTTKDVLGLFIYFKNIMKQINRNCGKSSK